MVATVFVDGEAGTTGLGIRERLDGRSDVRLVSAPAGLRRDRKTRRDHLNGADFVILCLPDAEAREAVALIETAEVRVIDASSAHRVAPGWIYGFPEMAGGQRAAIATARRVANPGCYATGFIALVRPLVNGGLIPRTWPLTVNAVSGYSGGGRAMIAEFEDPASPNYTTAAFRAYALGLEHKHVPEMTCYAGLAHPPLFAPAVARCRQGMIVEVPLQLRALPVAPRLAEIHEALARAYEEEPMIEVAPLEANLAQSVLDPEALNGGNRLRIHVLGSDRAGQARIAAVLDNLGKGASGAAVQNLNIMLGAPEAAGL